MTVHLLQNSAQCLQVVEHGPQAKGGAFLHFPAPHAAGPGVDPLRARAAVVKEKAVNRTRIMERLQTPAQRTQTPAESQELWQQVLVARVLHNRADHVAGIVARNCVDLNRSTSAQEMPLIAATGRGSDALKVLLQAPGIDVNARDVDGWTALLCAIKGHHRASLQELMRAPGLDVNGVVRKWTPLNFAIHTKNRHAAEALLAHKDIDVNARDDRTALGEAAFDNDLQMLELVLRTKGVDVNKVSKAGDTPLGEAAARADAAVVDRLLRVPGMEVNQGTRATPLQLAAINGREHIVGMLLSAPGLDINALNGSRMTALHCAADQAAIVRRLLAVPGIAVDLIDNNGHSPLSTAACQGNLEVVSLLLGAQGIAIDVNTLSNDTIHDLRKAASQGHHALLDMLAGLPAPTRVAEDKPLSL